MSSERQRGLCHSLSVLCVTHTPIPLPQGQFFVPEKNGSILVIQTCFQKNQVIMKLLFVTLALFALASAGYYME